MKKIKLIFLFISIFFLTGCLNYIELNSIGLINVIGISKSDANYVISINMLETTAEETEENKNYKVEASSITQAFDKLYLLTTKNINLSHLEVLILDKSLDKQAYDDIKSFFLTRNDSRNTFNVVILENYNDETLFKFEYKDINYLIETNHKEDGIVSPKSFDELIEDILNLNISYIPTIKVDEKLEILGYRTVYKNNKLFSIKESITHNFLTNNIVKANLIDENLNIKIDKSITNIYTDKSTIEININSTLTDYSNSSNIENKYNKTIKEYILEYLDNNDLNYFKQIIKKHNYNYYKNNKDKEVTFKVSVQSKINKEAKQNGK